MTRVLYQFLLLPLLLLLTGCWGGEVLEEPQPDRAFTQGQGVVAYSGYAPLSHKPIKVHYYIPKGDVTRMPILLVLPGVNRNAADYRQAWLAAADQKGVMVFSLEFPSGTYSGSEYIEGGMMGAQGLKPEAEWTFSMIEPLFDFITADLKSSRTTYDLWGHSAGAQFVHRYLLFKPGARIGQAASANAGWYTTPELSVDFPYGLKGTAATAATLQQVLGKKLLLQLGTADTDPNDPNLNHTPGAELQGPHRYARGQHFWQKAQTASLSGRPFGWQKQEVAGVAHDYTRMAASASALMY